MSVLKANDTAGVRSLPSIAVPIAAARQPVPDPPVDPRIAAITAELASVEAAFAAFRKQAVLEIDAARRAGLVEAQKDEDRRTSRFESGVADALAAWRERLDSLERLAAMLAEKALGKLFDDHTDLADLVARTIAKRVRAIDSGAVVRVRVSGRDFTDDYALDALATRVGLPREQIVVESDASAGACEIDLAVGHLDLTIGDQWRAIAVCLDAMASEDPA